MDMFQRQLALMFGHHRDAYVFGDGVIAFPTWFARRYPDMPLYKMKRQVGNPTLNPTTLNPTLNPDHKPCAVCR